MFHSVMRQEIAELHEQLHDDERFKIDGLTSDIEGFSTRLAELVSKLEQSSRLSDKDGEGEAADEENEEDETKTSQDDEKHTLEELKRLRTELVELEVTQKLVKLRLVMFVKQIQVILFQSQALGGGAKVDDVSFNQDKAVLSTMEIAKNLLEVVKFIKTQCENSDALDKKWVGVLTKKDKFSEKASTQQDPVTYLQSIQFIEALKDTLSQMELEEQSIEANDLDKHSDLIPEVLLHIGNLADRLQQGHSMFIVGNYHSQRAKEKGFGVQADKFVQIDKVNNEIEFNKAQYKDNWELLKKHKNLANFTEHNKREVRQEGFSVDNPVDSKLLEILSEKMQTQLRYIQLTRVSHASIGDNIYELGPRRKVRSKFCILIESMDEEPSLEDSGIQAMDMGEDAKNQEKLRQLCFSYGNCILPFDDWIQEISLREVKAQIILKMQQEYFGGLTKEDVKHVRASIFNQNALMFTKFAK
uniref:Uncharacterized protein n=1 Tax=Strombidium rassoulzadegani TaxID=1082188 RepID=A0A7S3CSI1_9SPIT|mmetsp:Transcript_6794/g.11429  ORF Transcript_6794/g.11429 Transcript_6794/m.11429 type:complete len:472 (+) Transcript_6794:2018-3433(+)